MPRTLNPSEVLALAEVHETGVDEMERHIFNDADLFDFVRDVIAASTKSLPPKSLGFSTKFPMSGEMVNKT